MSSRVYNLCFSALLLPRESPTQAYHHASDNVSYRTPLLLRRNAVPGCRRKAVEERRNSVVRSSIIGCFESDRAPGAIELVFAAVPPCVHAYSVRASLRSCFRTGLPILQLRRAYDSAPFPSLPVIYKACPTGFSLHTGGSRASRRYYADACPLTSP